MQLEVGTVCEGKVTGITGFGAFVELESGGSGLVHISEVSNEYVDDINNHLKVGQSVRAKVIKIEDGGKISLSIKKVQMPDKAPVRRPARPVKAPPKRQEDMTFEEKLAMFKKDSDEKISTLKRNTDSRRGGYRKSY